MRKVGSAMLGCWKGFVLYPKKWFLWGMGMWALHPLWIGNSHRYLGNGQLGRKFMKVFLDVPALEMIWIGGSVLILCFFRSNLCGVFIFGKFMHGMYCFSFFWWVIELGFSYWGHFYEFYVKHLMLLRVLFCGFDCCRNCFVFGSLLIC